MNLLVVFSERVKQMITINGDKLPKAILKISMLDDFVHDQLIDARVSITDGKILFNAREDLVYLMHAAAISGRKGRDQYDPEDMGIVIENFLYGIAWKEISDEYRGDAAWKLATDWLLHSKHATLAAEIITGEGEQNA